MKSSIRMEYKEEEMRKAAIYAEKRWKKDEKVLLHQDGVSRGGNEEGRNLHKKRGNQKEMLYQVGVSRGGNDEDSNLHYLEKRWLKGPSPSGWS
jgi:hypothetical protein